VSAYAGNGAREPLTEQLRRAPDDLRELGEEVAAIATELGVLVRKEGELARAELREEIGASMRALAFGGVAAVCALLTLVFAGLGLMFALDLAMPLWAAALITTGVAALTALLLGLLARASLKRATAGPQRTINSLKEDVTWARRQLNWSAK
jgi:uncharacterized membrane protein YqjE